MNLSFSFFFLIAIMPFLDTLRIGMHVNSLKIQLNEKLNQKPWKNNFNGKEIIHISK